MSQQSITIKTVTAPAFQDGSWMLTPRLELVVSYTKGGVNIFTGSSYPRGYELSVQHDRLSDQGFSSFLIDGKGNLTTVLEPAARFSAKTLERFANDVRSGKHDELIERLYAKAKANRSEYAWPDSILPLVEPVGITEDCLNRVLPVVADSWEQLRGCDVERLLDSISYDDQDSVADAADIIKAKRPDLAAQVDEAALSVADGYRV